LPRSELSSTGGVSPPGRVETIYNLAKISPKI